MGGVGSFLIGTLRSRNDHIIDVSPQVWAELRNLRTQFHGDVTTVVDATAQHGQNLILLSSQEAHRLLANANCAAIQLVDRTNQRVGELIHLSGVEFQRLSAVVSEDAIKVVNNAVIDAHAHYIKAMTSTLAEVEQMYYRMLINTIVIVVPVVAGTLYLWFDPRILYAASNTVTEIGKEVCALGWSFWVLLTCCIAVAALHVHTNSKQEARLHQLEARKALSFPVGSIISYAGLIDAQHPPPDGWLLCDGRQLDAVMHPQHRSLHLVIGNKFAPVGSGATHLPDLRDHFPMGASAQACVGSIGDGKLVLSVDQLPSHSFKVSGNTHGGNAKFHRAVEPLNAQDGSVKSLPSHNTGWHGGAFNDYTDANYPDADHTHWVDLTSSEIGKGEVIDVKPPFVAVHYLIKY